MQTSPHFPSLNAVQLLAICHLDRRVSSKDCLPTVLGLESFAVAVANYSCLHHKRNHCVRIRSQLVSDCRPFAKVCAFPVFYRLRFMHVTSVLTRDHARHADAVFSSLCKASQVIDSFATLFRHPLPLSSGYVVNLFGKRCHRPFPQYQDLMLR